MAREPLCCGPQALPFSGIAKSEKFAVFASLTNNYSWRRPNTSKRPNCMDPPLLERLFLVLDIGKPFFAYFTDNSLLKQSSISTKSRYEWFWAGVKGRPEGNSLYFPRRAGILGRRRSSSGLPPPPFSLLLCS